MKRIAMLMCCGAAMASAQPTTVVIGHVVRAADTTRALSGARVTVAGTTLESQAFDKGRFVLVDVPRGRPTLEIRMLGYQPWRGEIDANADTVRLSPIAMAIVPQVMGRVVIDGRRVEYPIRFEEQYARAARANGRFFTREQIDSLQPMETKSLLAMIPTIRVNDRSVAFARCDQGLHGMDPVSGRRAAGVTTAAQVYIDGVRMTRTGSENVNDAIRLVPPTAIQLMEVYTGVSRIPGEYLADACAVVLIWTKRY